MFVIDSSVYSLLGSLESPVYSSQGVVTPWYIHHWGVETSQCIHRRGPNLDWFTKESAQYTSSQDSPVFNTSGSLDSLVYY
jgi:hypothetical protein